VVVTQDRVWKILGSTASEARGGGRRDSSYPVAFYRSDADVSVRLCGGWLLQRWSRVGKEDRNIGDNHLVYLCLIQHNLLTISETTLSL